MAYPAGKSMIGNGVDRVLPQEVFLHFLDLEVKRSRRYQNFFSVLVLKLDELPDHDNGTAIQACWGRLIRLVAEEIRDSDILGALGEKRLAVILPYADLMAGGNTRSRFESSLQLCDFSRDGFRVVIDQVCFPRDGTDTSDLVRKVTGIGTLSQR